MSGARSAADRVTGPLRRNYQSGGRAAFASTGGSAARAASHAVPANQAPDWARTVRREQMQRDAGLAAASALRDGDRGGAGDGPRLKQDEDYRNVETSTKRLRINAGCNDALPKGCTGLG